MSDGIHYTCTCGAGIRMPASAAGKRARCKTCGRVFVVPAQDQVLTHSSGEEHAAAGAHSPGEHKEPPASWLQRLYEGVPLDEPAAAATTDDSPPALPLPVATTSGFWRDFIRAPLYVLAPHNLVTLVVLVGFGLLTGFFFFGSMILYGYMCSLYLAAIVETAAGEDHLPVLTTTEPGDNYFSILMRMFGCIVQFAGTFACALAPAICLALWMWYSGRELDWRLIQLVGLCCLVFWPAIILGVAIGGGFEGLWPHLVIRTALAAPLPYLAICAGVACTYLVMSYRQLSVVDWWLANHYSAALALRFADLFIGPYCALTCMRLIGLYYRHFKQRFPWTAE